MRPIKITLAAGLFFGTKLINATPDSATKAGVQFGNIVDAGPLAQRTKQRGRVDAKLIYDQSYVAPITFGKETFNLILDTGSADLWTYSKHQPKSQIAGRKVYSTSSGKKLHDYSWDITYADGDGASGTVYTDKVTIGNVTVTSQAVEAATSVSKGFEWDDLSNGLVGLGFSNGTENNNTVVPVPQHTFFENVKDSLELPLFAFDIRTDRPNTFDLGFIDPEKYSGPIQYINVDSAQGYWQIPSKGYSVGSGTNVKQGNVLKDLVIDSGTPVLIVPPKVAKQYYSTVKSATQKYGQYKYHCNETLPDFNVKIGVTIYTIPGSDTTFTTDSDDSTVCLGGISEGFDDAEFSIFGAVFMKSHYLVFEHGEKGPRLGIAKQY